MLWQKHLEAYGHQCTGKPDCSISVRVPSVTVRIERSAIEFAVERYGVLVLCFNLRRDTAAINSGALSVDINFGTLFLFVSLKVGN